MRVLRGRGSGGRWRRAWGVLGEPSVREPPCRGAGAVSVSVSVSEGAGPGPSVRLRSVAVLVSPPATFGGGGGGVSLRPSSPSRDGSASALPALLVGMKGARKL